ncbi:Crp/Fnr family transcriptional regulator [Burkholderia arboris]|uniref:Crp/Fnr family transcriptional regulator n=1 Tax=Burkholderia arboris TaxID=488730 RepID=UPI001CF50314|nr:Crp/Fnr family transcriptional regulator [Burkholderia arboris]MCA8037756.1 Crp/Fnr family transcriptional regulator [Burkholderia arboris]
MLLPVSVDQARLPPERRPVRTACRLFQYFHYSFFTQCRRQRFSLGGRIVKQPRAETMPALANAQTLRNIPILAGLPESLLAHIERHVTPWPEHGNRLLFFKGDPGDFVAFVHSGRVYKTLHEPGGREIILGHSMPGELIGENTLIRAHRRSFTAQLSADCRISLLYRQYFAPLLANAEFMGRIHEQLCRHIHQLSDFVESACLYRVEARLARHLLNRMQGNDLEVPLPENQSILAAMLNVSRPRLNSSLRKMQRDGLIRLHEHGVTIQKPEQLRTIVDAN